MHVGQKGAARRLQQCTNRFFRVLEAGPKEGDISGQAHVCFHCGHCGLITKAGDTDQSDGTTKAGICGTCGEDYHMNLVELVLPNGRRMPWMERGSKAPAVPDPSSHQTSGKQAVSKGRVKPNDACPCGSGKKAKRCCHAGGK